MTITTITNEQEIPLTVTPLTAGGNTSTVNGSPLWSSSNLNSVTLTVASDGLSATAFSAGIGSSIITVLANADLNPTGSIQQISGSIQINVVAAEATTLNVVAGTPVLG